MIGLMGTVKIFPSKVLKEQWKNRREDYCGSVLLLVTGGNNLFICSVLSNSLWPCGLQHTRPPCPSPIPGVYPNSCPLSWRCHPTTLSSVVSSSCLQSFPASGSFPVSQFFTSGGQSIEVSASTSVLPMNIQGWSPSEWTGWISLQAKGLWRVFSNTTAQKHQFFDSQLYGPTLTSIHDSWKNHSFG